MISTEQLQAIVHFNKRPSQEHVPNTSKQALTLIVSKLTGRLLCHESHGCVGLDWHLMRLKLPGNCNRHWTVWLRLLVEHTACVWKPATRDAICTMVKSITYVRQSNHAMVKLLTHNRECHGNKGKICKQ